MSESGTGLRLLTWNVQWCCGLDRVVDVARNVREARAFCDFDVLCLQEVAVNYPRLPGAPSHDQPALLAQLLPGYQLYYGPAVDELARDGTRQQFGNLIASRLPVAQVAHHMLPYPAEAGKKSMPRCCSVATVLTPLGPVRVMSTHMEFYSPRQRLAQLQALRALHAQACEQAAYPPLDDETGWPFQNKVHTRHAILCGDWNLEPDSEHHLALQAAFEPVEVPGQPAGFVPDALFDYWKLANPGQPHASTFQLFDRIYRPEPISVDYIFVSEGLRRHVRRVEVNLQTRASDHQPVLIELAL